LEFTVLADGSISSVLPVVKSDQMLECEAISALSTWRFDPPPPQLPHAFQKGKVTFAFKLKE